MIQAITQGLYADNPNETLYHYTNFNGLMGIVRSGVLWASDIRYMNDSAELQHTADLIRDEVQRRSESNCQHLELLQQFQQWVSNRINSGHMVFAASFHTNGNLLSQWRGYSEVGKGVSLGFDLAHLTACARAQRFEIARCIYDAAQQASLIAQVIDAVIEYSQAGESFAQITDKIESDLLRIAAVLKHPSFEEESEWRLISPVITDYVGATVDFREGASMLVPYVKFDLNHTQAGPLVLDHLYLGPTTNITPSMNSLRMFLDKYAIHPQRGISYCQIPYRQC